jgi:hypothetical protein
MNNFSCIFFTGWTEHESDKTDDWGATCVQMPILHF